MANDSPRTRAGRLVIAINSPARRPGKTAAPSGLTFITISSSISRRRGRRARAAKSASVKRGCSRSGVLRLTTCFPVAGHIHRDEIAWAPESEATRRVPRHRLSCRSPTIRAPTASRTSRRIHVRSGCSSAVPRRFQRESCVIPVRSPVLLHGPQREMTVEIASSESRRKLPFR